MENKTEYKVGEVFQFGKKKLKCVLHGEFDCTGCVLYRVNSCRKFVGECTETSRKDRNDVIFIEVDEIENKES